MKKLINLTILTAVLALVLAACNKPIDPTGTQAYLPKPAAIVNVMQSDSTMTLTASAEGATGYIWRRVGGIGIPTTTNTFVVANDGYFPDTVRIAVAGTNAVGTGNYGEITELAFIHQYLPEINSEFIFFADETRYQSFSNSKAKNFVV